MVEDSANGGAIGVSLDQRARAAEPAAGRVRQQDGRIDPLDAVEQAEPEQRWRRVVRRVGKRCELRFQRITRFVSHEARRIPLAQPCEAIPNLSGIARRYDLAGLGMKPGFAVRPRVVEQDEGAERPCHAAASGPFPAPRRGRLVCSTFDLFKIGVGPSSSHTMGPMTAACRFVETLRARGLLESVERVEADLYGSLALTGKGHATDRAVLLGLAGERPDGIDPDAAERLVFAIRETGRLKLGGGRVIPFDEARDLRFNQREKLPHHSNGMRFTATLAGGGNESAVYYSVGGGAVVDESDVARNAPPEGGWDIPFSFSSGDQLLEIAERDRLAIADIARANERAALSDDEIDAKLDAIDAAMAACIDRGMGQKGILPGGLNVKRRAPDLYRLLTERAERALQDPLTVLDWVNLWALAVNEENAAGGKVVTAPTNGAAGIVPAVLRYYQRFTPRATQEGTRIFLLTAAAIGSLFKENASISGAEVGCQGEVGVACSMAAAGLTAALGGTPAQVENAAEIGMEHNLGLTCDPVGGLVQVPCIERNAVGAVKAIEASRLALVGDGSHRVSLDQVIETMRRTGLDMNERYKETSLGGLAVNVVEC